MKHFSTYFHCDQESHLVVDVPLRKLSKCIILFLLQEMGGLELRPAGAYLVLGSWEGGQRCGHRALL